MSMLLGRVSAMGVEWQVFATGRVQFAGSGVSGLKGPVTAPAALRQL
jgi:hypothetical protein